MRLLVLFISFLISQVADSQIISASPPYRVTAAAVSCTYILDTYTGAAAAYSLRKLDADYAGNCIRVRRSSDNTEQDFAFSGCVVDTAGMKTFVGANDGFVVSWYDQSGNSRTVSQPTLARQPRIVASGAVEYLNGYPTLYFQSASNNLQRADFTNSGSAATLYAVAKNDADPTSCNTCGALVENTASAQSSHFPYSDGNIYDGWFSTSRPNTGNPSISLASTFLYCAISAASDWRSYINNSSHYTTTSNTVGSNSGFIIGASANTTYSYLGRVSEIIIYGSASSDADRNGISGNINTFYSIY